MAHSLPGERSIVAGSHVNPVRALAAWLAQAKITRARRKTFRGLLELNAAQLNDLGLDRGDILDALAARNGRTPAMVLNAARARNARA